MAHTDRTPVISSGNIDRASRDLLRAGDRVLTMSYEHGWVCWVDEDVMNDDEVPEPFRDALRQAHDEGCQWVRFDSNVEPHWKLGIFDFEAGEEG